VSVIDAHHHIWDLDRAAYPWLTPEAGVLHRTHTLAETAAERARLGIDGVVLVQAADNDADTALMLDVAAADPAVRGVVGWVPLDDPAGVRRRLRDWAERAPGLVVGIRSLIHERPDPSWITSRATAEGLDLVTEAGLSFDVVTADPRALSLVPVLAERHPDLTLVVDHLGKPPALEHEGWERWRSLLAACAQHPRVAAKVSGIVPPSGDDGAVLAAVAHAVDVFGSDRLMLGSDWPIAELSGGYGPVWNTLVAAVRDTAGADAARMLGGTAQRVYRLPARGAAPDEDRRTT
jgi:L-fuconolactonase